MTCKCITVKDALHLAFNNQRTPTCPEHDKDPGIPAEAIALNDDQALAAKLGMPLTKGSN